MADLSGPGTYAVVIGTGTHRPGSALPDVPSVHSTVEDISRCLIDRCGLNPRNLQVRLDSSDPGELQTLIQRTSSRADRLFILYYVGHGIIDEHLQLHLATAITADPNRVEYGRTLPYEIIRNAIYDTSAPGRDRATVIILDCCYSGRVRAVTGTPAQAGFSQSAIRGTYVLTSAEEDGEAWAPIGQRHTSFSGGMIDLLTTGDPDGPAFIDFNSVYDYLLRTLGRQGAPQPRRHVEDNVGGIQLARNPGYEQPVPMPPLVAGQLEETAKPPCPYMGLRPFGINDHAFFFGRESLIAQLIERMRNRVDEPGIQVVTGPSGVGKTSLLRAGMMHAIASGELNAPDSAAWDQLPPFAPGDDPLLSFARVLAPHRSAGASGTGSLETIHRQLAEHPELAGDLLRGLRPNVREGKDRRVILVIDQFEEVFTACQDEATRVAFFRALRAAAFPAADGRPSAALVALGIRSDFLGLCGAYPDLNEALGATAFLVGPMSRDELRQAIVKPAEIAGLGLEDGLVEVLLRDADPGIARGHSDAGVQGILPLLSYALSVTWRRAEYEQWHDAHGLLHSGWSLRIASYNDAGGIQGALSTSAETIYGSLSEDLQEKARLMFLFLVESRNEAGAFIDVRRRARRDELQGAPGGAQAADVVINAFAGARLMTIDGDYVEIVHEALLRAWTRLGSWIDDSRERLLARQRVSAAAEDWDSEGRHASALLQGPRLAAARLLITSGADTPELSELAGDFLSRSVRRTRRRARLLYTTIIAVLTIFVLAAVGGQYALSQQKLAHQQEEDNQVGQLIAESRTVSQSNPRLSVLLALDAYHWDPDTQTYVQLESDLTQTRYSGMLTGGNGAVDGVAYQPGGSGLLASANSDGTVILWKPVKEDGEIGHEANQQVGDFTVKGGAGNLAFSDNGVLAVGSSGGKIQLWNVVNPRRPSLLASLNAVGNGDSASGATTYIAFRPHGNTLAATDNETTLTTWDVGSTGQPAQLSQTDVSSGCPQADGKNVGDIAFSPDGQTLLIGCDHLPGAALWDMSNPYDPLPLSSMMTGGDYSTSAIAFSPDGNTVAMTAGYSPSTYLWNVTNRKSPALMKQLTGQGVSISSIAFSADGSRLATASADDTTELWNVTDLAEPEEMAMLQGQQGPVRTVAFSPDGNMLATGSDDKTVMLWNADISANTPVLAAIPDQYGTANSVSAVAVHGNILEVSYSHGPAGFWNISNPENPVVLSGATSSELGDSPQGKLTAIGAEGGADGVTLYNNSNPSNPVALANIDRGDIVYAAAISPNGKLLANTTYNSGVLIWNIANPRRPTQLADLNGNIGVTNNLAFGPDGTLATSGFDNTVIVWDLAQPASPVEAASLSNQDVGAFSFSPNSQVLVTQQWPNYTVKLWSIASLTDSIRQPVQVGCGIAQPRDEPGDWSAVVPHILYQTGCLPAGDAPAHCP
jgi:WD40 repeat protein